MLSTTRQARDKMKRFSSVNEIDLKQLLIDKDSKNTQNATRVAFNIFESYLLEKEITMDFKTVESGELNELLKRFYVEVRKQDGTMYSRATMNSIRFGIQRKFHEIRNDVNIIDSVEFKTSNEIFRAQCVHLKKEGLGKVNHKKPITPEDMKKLYQSNTFSLENPKSLQRKVFFDVMLYLCRRGRENLKSLKKKDFIVKVGESGEYVEKVIDELTKNRRENNEAEEGGVILATGKESCPVKSFKKYVSLLNPKVEEFFQRPKVSSPESGPWYDAQVLGINSLGSMMRNISADASLSESYTNHCIRATSVTILDQCGFQARHIMSLSGHRSESSIRSYARTGVAMKRKMSEELSKFCEENTTFDFGVNVSPSKAKQVVRTNISSLNPTNNQTPTPAPSSTANLASFIGHSAQRVLFKDCVFNFNQS